MYPRIFMKGLHGTMSKQKEKRTPAAERPPRLRASLSHTFGQRVIDLRNEREWSQKHLAGTAGVDQGHISRIESGQTELCLGSLATLAKAFGLGLSELLKGV
jgi:ribosome-binding protein aMBF1 (putative translation factor)